MYLAGRLGLMRLWAPQTDRPDYRQPAPHLVTPGWPSRLPNFIAPMPHRFSGRGYGVIPLVVLNQGVPQEAAFRRSNRSVALVMSEGAGRRPADFENSIFGRLPRGRRPRRKRLNVTLGQPKYRGSASAGPRSSGGHPASSSLQDEKPPGCSPCGVSHDSR
jgi:hypothetical protein